MYSINPFWSPSFLIYALRSLGMAGPVGIGVAAVAAAAAGAGYLIGTRPARKARKAAELAIIAELKRKIASMPVPGSIEDLKRELKRFNEADGLE